MEFSVYRAGLTGKDTSYLYCALIGTGKAGCDPPTQVYYIDLQDRFFYTSHNFKNNNYRQ